MSGLRSAVIARDGNVTYPAPLSILVWETKVPRVPCGMGNAATWPFPLLYCPESPRE